MVCDTKWTFKGQTREQRKSQIKEAIAQLDAMLKKRRVVPVVGPNGAIAFRGWTDQERSQISDACAYRYLMATGSALARAEIARAEQLSGRSVNRQALAAGVHSHDGGNTWHEGH
jgi:hypothetical protein